LKILGKRFFQKWEGRREFCEVLFFIFSKK
jgi:hypothetical protein